MDTLLADSIEELLASLCEPRHVRAVEAQARGTEMRALWQSLEDSGFMDALVVESSGGSGLSLRDAAPIAFACGRHALPVPMALTMLARAAAAEAGHAAPAGPIAIAPAAPVRSDGCLLVTCVPFGLVADHVVVPLAEGAQLWPLDGATRRGSGGHGGLAANIEWNAAPQGAPSLAAPGADWQAIGAAVLAAQLAGAMERAAEMTVLYANQRVQFGKPIGKFQAIQQQISAMAEEVAAARMAATIGLASASWRVAPVAAAIAKARTSEAATQVAAICHAAHGAIGVTEEYDLQLFTRRLREWSRDFGGPSYWNEQLGRRILAGAALPPDLVGTITDRMAA